MDFKNSVTFSLSLTLSGSLVTDAATRLLLSDMRAFSFNVAMNRYALAKSAFSSLFALRISGEPS